VFDELDRNLGRKSISLDVFGTGNSRKGKTVKLLS